MSLRNPDNAPPSTRGEESAGGFPQDPSEFDNDPRISFSRLDNKFILETEDGQEFEYDTALKRWVQAVDDALLEQQREAYRVEGVDDDETVTGSQLKKKRKTLGDDNGQKQKKARVNTAVYVTSIPLNATLEEINDVFCKCGVIAEEIDSGRPRIKMYLDDGGKFKGEALVVYFRPESVNLAIQMLDDTNFRLGEAGPQGTMKVQVADFSFKSQQDVPTSISNRDKKKIIKRTQKLNNKLADWDDDDPSTLPDTSSRWSKVVVLKHMFTLAEIEKDPAAILDIKEDIRDECSKLGEITNVVLYDQEPNGVVTVRFSDPDAARQCVKVMGGRYFGGTQVEAYIADGSEKFKKTNERRAALEDMAEGRDEEDDRLEGFGSWLENQQESERVVENTAR
ncbi:nuclear mRNA splicing factor-associated protein [Talaromyces proteolyticus]|uniref:Nuclear mRNA splicing factor-associated protein n=1 Tax=Talaromyces proteolyticus TaxID=1131652 RepID=A0AAD4KQX4_9EURO|nr:nuclear mRNA splicing factor-associated protein [Talaromyces proteolyticus]KAH8697340.1 nuclear mRNA splicing factor-associated protein [Talaromyces proteolyticus]